MFKANFLSFLKDAPVEKEADARGMGDEKQISLLRDHPGFIALQNLLDKKKALFEAQLKRRQENIRAVDALQIYIEAFEFMGNEVDRKVKERERKWSQALHDEPFNLQQIQSVIEHITPYKGE